MATPNVGILTNAGKDLIDRVNAGQTKITFTKIVFSSMDNSQLTDDKIRALTTVTPQEVVVNNPEVTLDNSTGETRIRATGTNEKLDDGVYVKTYGVFAKDDTGNEILYGLTVSPNPNYFPAYDGVTPQVVTYSYKVIISNTSNITFTNSNDIYLSETDLGESLKPYAKIVYVNQQLDKKVNVADMRKPASDVAGVEEVNAKQDRIGYTPADDSKVVHSVDMVNSDVYGLQIISSGSANNLPKGTVFCTNAVTDLPNESDAWTIRTTYTDIWGARRTQIAIADSANLMFYRTSQGGINDNYGDWKQLLTADQLPPDIARTGQSQTFTAAQTFSSAPTVLDTSSSKGDNQAAVMADLKSVERAAWHQLNTDYVYQGGTFLYKIDQSSNRIYLSYFKHFEQRVLEGTTIADFSSIVNNIEKIMASSGANDLTHNSPASIVASVTIYAGDYVVFSDGSYFTYDSLR